MDSFLERLQPVERAGSKPRCHWLTHGEPSQVARRLNELAEPYGCVSADHQWMPEGFSRIQEAQLDKAARLIPKQEDRDQLRGWWLAASRPTTLTPNWDIASTCTVGGRKGLLLVEAKAHTQELKIDDRVGAGSPTANESPTVSRGPVSHWQITTELKWALSHEHRYQMANRFAWSWKLTQLGYPVILVYLGFLQAEEMETPFTCHAEWEDLVKSHSRPLFPAEIWDHQLVIHGQPFVPRICSDRTRFDGPIGEE